jgi:DNA-binding helix-hairpin-helix protein with protein kinase domain
MTQTSSLHHKLPLLDMRGTAIKLGPSIARGGEGEIFPVSGQPNTVAKIYHTTISTEKTAKLHAMTQLSSEQLRAVTAWPTATLHHIPNGPIRGILMPAVVAHKEIHVLYGPKTRLREFPDATLPFLLHIAANLARAFARIHEQGHVIGDVNHGSVLVAKDGTVKLVDCDSFQIAFGGRQLLCTVGVPTHTPPELQGKPLGGIVRTPNHDAFGLAVLIFQLLFLGRHPFAGTFLGRGEPALEKAIEEFRFAYGPGAIGRQMRQPPATPALDSSTPTIATLFERAFSREGYERANRPSAREWVATLGQAAQQLIVCGRNSGHHYARGLSACPWCAIESVVGITLFNVALLAPAGATARSAFDLEKVWAAIMAVADPGQAPILPLPNNLPIEPSPEARAHGAELRRLRKVQHIALAVGMVSALLALLIAAAAVAASWIMILTALGCFGLGFIAYRGRQNNAILAGAKSKKALATARLNTLRTRWHAEAGAAQFTALRTQLEREKGAYQALALIRQQRMRDLTSGARQRQLTLFLQRHRIASATIPNIGPGRKATLLSFNIETAADVTQTALLGVPGFGPAMTTKLLAWRATIESRFVFNGQQAIDPSDLGKIERDIANLRIQHERTLSQGAAQLQSITDQVRRVRTALREAGDQAQIDLAQAEVDLKILGA